MIIISRNQSNNQKKIIQTPTVETVFGTAEETEGSKQVQKPSTQENNAFVRKIIEKECINHFFKETIGTSCNISRVKLTLSENYAASLEFIEGKTIFIENLITKDRFINYLAENIQNRIETLQFKRKIKDRFADPRDVYKVAQDIISHTLNRTVRITDDILTSPGSNTAINGTESECFTLPSSKHSDNNQDRIYVISRDDISIIMVCDGVSGSGDKTVQGTQTGGGEAAEKSLNIIWHLFEPIKESIIQPINQWTNIYDNECTLEKLNGRIKEILKEFCTTKFMDIVEKQTDLKDTDGATTMELCLKLSIRNVPFIITLSIGDSETIIQFSDQSLIQLNADVIKGHRESNETDTPNIYNIDDLKEIQKKHKPYSDPIAHVNKDNYPIPTISYCWGQDVKRIISFTDGISDGISTINENGACLDNELMETLLNFCDLTEMSNKEICRFLNAVAMCISKKEDDVTIGMLDGPLMRG